MGEGATKRPRAIAGATLSFSRPAGLSMEARVSDGAMRRAIEVARGARRHTAPWPAVGCVVERDGEIAAVGATGSFPIGPHAEVAALRAAGDRARGATVYSTLEPCDHQGNTPPCTAALVEAGVAKVVVAVDDPDERVAGRGYKRLEDAGIEVVRGVCTSEAARDLAPYLHHRRTGRAFVTAKVALSIDGRIAACDGSSQWLTSEAALADVHELRADTQAIVVGSGTALADRPRLTVRGAEPAPAAPPLRVLLDARGRVPAAGPLFDPALAPTLVVTTAAAPPEAVDAWNAAGAKVETVGGAETGVDLDAVFKLLADHGVLHALIEGGGTLLSAVFDGGHAQRLVAYIAPLVLGPDATPGFAGAGPKTLADAKRLSLEQVTALGPDVRLDYTVGT